jgi:dihydroxyacetone kinase-like predicted kinase
MLKPGVLMGDALEAGSMARAIEDAMVAQGVLVLSDETEDAAEMRRKAFIAIATGVITHLKSSLEVKIVAGKFAVGNPPADALLRGQDGVVT